MTVIESIVRDLHELPPTKLVEVARYVHGLNPKSHERRRAALLATAVRRTLERKGKAIRIELGLRFNANLEEIPR